MKYYLLEPSYKKSVYEYDLFKRQDSDGNTIFLRKELGWRYGSFLISVPENEKEASDYITDQGYDDWVLWAGDYGHLEYDSEKMDYITEGVEISSLVEWIAQSALPDENDEHIDITEDYPNAEMLVCDDGCWQDWEVYSYSTEVDEDDADTWKEDASEAFDEDYQEGVEALGWEYVDSYFEMHCNPKLTPCDERGVVWEESN